MSTDFKAVLNGIHGMYDKCFAEYNMSLGKAQALDNSIKTATDKITALNSESQTKDFVSQILSKVAEQSRHQAKVKLEDIVTDAIQFSSQDNTKRFVIEEIGTRAKPSYDFYIETVTNGVSTKKDIFSSGGGYVDIASATLKYTYYEIFSDPKVMNTTLLYDEPSKMVSEGFDVKFAQYVQFIAKQFHRQPIMVTHNANLAMAADKSFSVSINNGISTVTEQTNQINMLAGIQDLIPEDIKKGNFDNEKN